MDNIEFDIHGEVNLTINELKELIFSGASCNVSLEYEDDRFVFVLTIKFSDENDKYFLCSYSYNFSDFPNFWYLIPEEIVDKFSLFKTSWINKKIEKSENERKLILESCKSKLSAFINVKLTEEELNT